MHNSSYEYPEVLIYSMNAGELDRAKLGALIFPDPSARRRLNKATHLPVFLELFRQLLMCWLRFCAVVVSSCTTMPCAAVRKYNIQGVRASYGTGRGHAPSV